MYEYEEGYNVRGSAMAGIGNHFPKEFTGERIGTIVCDPVKKDLRIIVHEPWPLDPRQPKSPNKEV